MKKIKKYIKMVFVLLLVSIQCNALISESVGDTISDCKFTLNNGEVVKLDSIWKIHNGVVEFENRQSLHDVLVSDIKKIFCSGKEYTIFENNLIEVIKKEDINQDSYLGGTHNADSLGTKYSNTDYFKLGREDAKKYYSGTGAFVGGVLGGPYLGLVIMAIPPAPARKKNPNRNIYFNNLDYKKGYRRTAHGKKAIMVTAGILISTMALIGMSGGF